MIDKVGLRHAIDRPIGKFSKGMMQRVGLAQALLHDPELLVLDEPMSGLDPLGRKEIRDLVLRLRSEGKTIFMNTHILADVEMLCDRVAIIARGRIVDEGQVDGLLDDGERVVDVVLAGLEPDVAVELESRFEARLRGLGDRIELRIDEKHVDAVLKQALTGGARVVSVTPHRESLEAVFLSALKAGERQENS